MPCCASTSLTASGPNTNAVGCSSRVVPACTPGGRLLIVDGQRFKFRILDKFIAILVVTDGRVHSSRDTIRCGGNRIHQNTLKRARRRAQNIGFEPNQTRPERRFVCSRLLGARHVR